MGKKRSIQKTAVRLLQGVFDQPAAQAILTNILEEHGEDEIKERYEAQLAYDQCQGGKKQGDKKGTLIELVGSAAEELGVPENWFAAEREAQQERLREIRDAAVNISSAYIRERGEAPSSYPVKEAVEFEAVCLPCSGQGKKRLLARIYAEEGHKPVNHGLSYSGFIYPSLAELVNGEIRCSECHGTDIDLKEAAKIIFREKDMPAERKQRVIDDILARVLDKAKDEIPWDSRRHSRLNGLRHLLDDPDMHTFRAYLVHRLNQLPFSTSTDDYEVLWALFSGFARHNLSHYNESGLCPVRRLPQGLLPVIKDVIAKYDNPLAPLVLIRYGAKDLERLQQKMSQILFGSREDEKNYINDFYRFRAVVRNGEECYTMSSVAQRYKGQAIARIALTRDYIIAPKPNGYSSLHHLVEFRDGRKASFQVRDHQMDLESERSQAQAHEGYADDIKSAVGRLPPHYVRLMEIVLAR